MWKTQQLGQFGPQPGQPDYQVAGVIFTTVAAADRGGEQLFA